MAVDKKSFVLYKSWLEVVNKLSNDQAGVLFKAILEFVNEEHVSIEDKDVKSIYDAITDQIMIEWSKYNPKTKKYHWNYKNGITPENKTIRNSSEMKYWRNSVFERDKYTCMECRKKGGELNAHHKKEFSKFPELRFDLSNGITLCKKCHIKIHSKKEREVNNG